MLELSAEQVQRKYETLQFYKTQMSYSKSWMVSFARRNEIYLNPTPLLLKNESQAPMSTRSDITHVHPAPETEAYETESSEGDVTGVTFRQTPDHLVIRIGLQDDVPDDLGISMAIFGYRSDRPFATMPKIRLFWEDGSLRVMDQSVPVRSSGLRVSEGRTEVTFRTPWNLLGRPETLFVEVRGLRGVLSISELGWEIIKRPAYTPPGSKP
jgi:hypothetical protein